MKITDTIKYIGVNDHDIDLFEGQYIVPLGMAYNSYVILDEKIAVMDSVDAAFGEEWLANLEAVLEGKTPDYLIVQHMEPDHSANIIVFAEKYPSAQIVSSKQAFVMMKNFFGTDFAERRIVVAEGSELDLGSRALKFIGAPMVHWPEVIMTYDPKDKILFSADGFGKFGANDVEDPEGWACEARRYYFGIVGKFGPQVQAVLKKAAALDIQVICPLHGPVLDENLGYYLDTYNTWSSYGVESEGIAVFYTSVYGGIKKAAELLGDELEKRGEHVEVIDLAREDMAESVEDAFRYGKIVFATTTYNGDMFPTMKTFIEHLKDHAYQNRTVAFMESGCWAPQAAKKMKEALEGCKDMTFAESSVKILCTPNDATKAQVEALADELCK